MKSLSGVAAPVLKMTPDGCKGSACIKDIIACFCIFIIDFLLECSFFEPDLERGRVSLFDVDHVPVMYPAVEFVEVKLRKS